MNPLQYIVTFARAAGGAIIDGLIARPNFNDMANLSLTSPSNGSATFNGTSDYVATNIPNASWPTQYSVSFWANIKSGSSDGMPFVLGGGYSVDGFFIQYRPSSNAWEIWWTLANNTNSSIQIANVAVAGEWAFITMTYNGSTLNLYKNGSLIGSASTTIKTPTTYNAQIGRYQNGAAGYWWNGNLANVAVWNRALTSDEINSIQWKRYDLLTSGESTGLVAWYALDDITGTSVPDSTGTYNATAY
jgi:hypothetical protein